DAARGCASNIHKTVDCAHSVTGVTLPCATDNGARGTKYSVREGTVADWTSLRLTWEPRILSILRFVTGLLFLQHGLNKFFNFPPAATQRVYDLYTLSPGLAGILEVVGGSLLIVGLFTRPVAFILCGGMALAYFMSHAPRAFYPYSNG